MEFFFFFFQAHSMISKFKTAKQRPSPAADSFSYMCLTFTMVFVIETPDDDEWWWMMPPHGQMITNMISFSIIIFMWDLISVTWIQPTCTFRTRRPQILLLRLPECWEYRHVSLILAPSATLFSFSNIRQHMNGPYELQLIISEVCFSCCNAQQM